MQTSESVVELVSALAKSQSEFEQVQRTMTNAFFHSKYATLDDMLFSCMPVLSANGLAIIQPIETVENGDTILETRLFHTSGEWLSSKVKVPTMQQKGANALQEFGIGITYMRRYMLSSLLGISTEDDNDGNKPKQDAKPRPKQDAKPKPQQPEKAFDPNAVTKMTFQNDWMAMLNTAIEHLENVTDIEKAKAGIKEKFEGKATVLEGWEFLRDEYTEQVPEDDEVF